MLFELAAVRNLEISVDWAQPLRILLHPDLILLRGHSDEGVEGIADGAGVFAANVVILARNGINGDQHIIGTDGIPNIGVGPKGVQIAHLHHRRDKALLNHSNLLGKCGFVENISPAGAGVGEHPGGHNGHAVGLGVVPAHQVGTNLGDGIRGGRVEGAVLMDALGGLQLRRNLAEDLGGGTDMDDRFAFSDTKGLQQVTGSDDVCVQGVDGGVEAGLGIALGRQVENIVGPDLLDDGEEGDQIVKVGVAEEDPVLVVGTVKEVLDVINGAPPAADTVDVPVGVFYQVVRQVRTYHTGDAGDKGFGCHFYRLFL